MNLREKAKKLRIDTLALAVASKEAHIASAFSIIEILVALYEEVLADHDKFILSKGHGCLSLYSILRQHGLDPTISGHPDIERDQGIECTTGSLGHGLPIGTGIALARKLSNKQGNIYVLVGDGECNEGTTWESALIAAQHKLDNLVVIIDNNKIQSLGKTEDILSMNSLSVKFEAFNWHADEIDGHNIQRIIDALKESPSGKPKVIIAHTVKGKGVSFMENRPEWHNRLPSEEELKVAQRELS